MNNHELSFAKDLITLNDSDISKRSCLLFALKSARKHTGRDINNGQESGGLLEPTIFQNNIYIAEYFTGLTIYLILLEQIGHLFQKSNYKYPINQKISPIRVALENFHTIDNVKIHIIRELRNSLVHNFGLSTLSSPTKTNTPSKYYKFCLHFEEQHPEVIPNFTWQGNYSDKSDLTDTNIGVFQLCNVIEKVYSNLVSEMLNNNLELRITNLDEIKTRFTIK